MLVFSSLFLFQENLTQISRCDPTCSGCAEVSPEGSVVGVNLGQHWPKNNSQRWIMPGPNSTSGFLSCFISFSRLAQEKLPDPIFMLSLKLDLRKRSKFMKSLNSADCRLPKGVFTDFLGNSGYGLNSHKNSLTFTGGFLVLLVEQQWVGSMEQTGVQLPKMLKPNLGT